MAELVSLSLNAARVEGLSPTKTLAWQPKKVAMATEQQRPGRTSRAADVMRGVFSDGVVSDLGDISLGRLWGDETLENLKGRLSPTRDAVEVKDLWSYICTLARDDNSQTWPCLRGYVPSLLCFVPSVPGRRDALKGLASSSSSSLCAVARRRRRCVSSLSACVVSVGEFTCGAFDRKRRRDGSSSICRASRLPPPPPAVGPSLLRRRLPELSFLVALQATACRHQEEAWFEGP